MKLKLATSFLALVQASGAFQISSRPSSVRLLKSQLRLNNNYLDNLSGQQHEDPPQEKPSFQEPPREEPSFQQPEQMQPQEQDVQPVQITTRERRQFEREQAHLRRAKEQHFSLQDRLQQEEYQRKESTKSCFGEFSANDELDTQSAVPQGTYIRYMKSAASPEEDIASNVAANGPSKRYVRHVPEPTAEEDDSYRSGSRVWQQKSVQAPAAKQQPSLHRYVPQPKPKGPSIEDQYERYAKSSMEEAQWHEGAYGFGQTSRPRVWHQDSVQSPPPPQKQQSKLESYVPGPPPQGPSIEDQYERYVKPEEPQEHEDSGIGQTSQTLPRVWHQDSVQAPPQKQSNFERYVPEPSPKGPSMEDNYERYTKPIVEEPQWHEGPYGIDQRHVPEPAPKAPSMEDQYERYVKPEEPQGQEDPGLTSQTVPRVWRQDSVQQPPQKQPSHFERYVPEPRQQGPSMEDQYERYVKPEEPQEQEDSGIGQTSQTLPRVWHQDSVQPPPQKQSNFERYVPEPMQQGPSIEDQYERYVKPNEEEEPESWHESSYGIGQRVWQQDSVQAQPPQPPSHLERYAPEPPLHQEPSIEDQYERYVKPTEESAQNPQNVQDHYWGLTTDAATKHQQREDFKHGSGGTYFTPGEYGGI